MHIGQILEIETGSMLKVLFSKPIAFILQPGTTTLDSLYHESGGDTFDSEGFV